MPQPLPENHEDVSYQEMGPNMSEYDEDSLRTWAVARIRQLQGYSWEASQGEIGDIRRWIRTNYPQWTSDEEVASLM